MFVVRWGVMCVCVCVYGVVCNVSYLQIHLQNGLGRLGTPSADFVHAVQDASVPDRFPLCGVGLDFWGVWRILCLGLLRPLFFVWLTDTGVGRSGLADLFWARFFLCFPLYQAPDLLFL